jgi:hypothetical protein
VSGIPGCKLDPFPDPEWKIKRGPHNVTHKHTDI